MERRFLKKYAIYWGIRFSYMCHTKMINRSRERVIFLTPKCVITCMVQALLTLNQDQLIYYNGLL